MFLFGKCDILSKATMSEQKNFKRSAIGKSSQRPKKRLKDSDDSDSECTPPELHEFLEQIKAKTGREASFTNKVKFFYIFLATSTGAKKFWSKVEKSSLTLFTKHNNRPIVSITSPDIVHYINKSGPRTPRDLQSDDEPDPAEPTEDSPITVQACDHHKEWAAEELVSKLIDEELTDMGHYRIEIARQILDMTANIQGGRKCTVTELSPESAAAIRANLRGIAGFMKAVAVILSKA